MGIRWQDIQNLSVTIDQINLLAGLTANASELNELAGFTGTAADLNALVGTDGDLAAHEALDFTTAHPIAANSLDGLLLTDNTVSQSKLSFNVALDTDISGLQTQVDDIVSDTAVQQTQIDNLYSIIIPGQGSDLADAIAQTVAHIELTEDAHDASAISYGNYYALAQDITAGATTSNILPLNIIKHFRAGESIRLQDDVTGIEDVVLSSVNYNTGEIIFPVTTNSYTVLDNGIIWTLAEDNVKETLDRSLRNNTDVFSGRLTVNQNSTDHALVLNQTGAGNELHLTSGIIGSDNGYDLEIETGDVFSVNHDTNGERFLVNDAGDGYLTQLLLREEGTAFHGTLTKSTLTADRTWTFRDLDMIIGNPDLTGNALRYLRVNADETDVEWNQIAASEITFDDLAAGLGVTNLQDAVVALDSNIDNHIADTANPHTVTITQAVTADAGTDVTVVELETLTDGSNADLLHDHDHQSITGAGTNTHAQIDSHIADATIHRSINDLGVSTTDLWSADKINSELGLLAPAGHNHTLDSLSNVDNTGIVAGSILEWNGTTDWIIGVKGEQNTASNLGAGEGLFNAKVGSDLQFKSLTAGANVTLTDNGTSVEITAVVPGGGETNTASNVGTGSGVFKQKVAADLEFYSLAAGSNITINQVGDTLEIASTASGGGGAGGTAITRNQVGHGFAVLDGIYHNGTQWIKALANDPESLAEYVVTDVTDADNFEAYKFGEVTITGHGKTVGEHYFLSDTVAGGSQITEPSDFSSPLYYVEDANTIHIEVYRPSDVTEVIGDNTPYQVKVLSSGTSSIGVLSDLTFNNLEVGKTYRFMMQMSSSDGNFKKCLVKDGTAVIGSNENESTQEMITSCTGIFQATDTTLTFEMTANAGLGVRGNGTRGETYAQLEELPTYTPTTQWN